MNSDMGNEILPNFIGGRWERDKGSELIEVHNPATGETIASVAASTPSTVDEAVGAAASALTGWKEVSPTDRIQYLFKLKTLLEDQFEDLSRTIVLENGKTLGEARGEMRRAIENVEVACGIPTLMQGDFLEDIARGIDEMVIRQPVGVCAIIAPFNFPGMIPFWFLPYAIATGNTCIVKPSEKTPLTMQKAARLIEECGLPAGVVNVVHGAADTVNALLDHPGVQAISFVGSTRVAREVYARAAASGKRVQASGGAKNPTIVLPDVDIDEVTPIIADSAFGNAGQRCLATSLTITVGDATPVFVEAISSAARQRRVGYGLEEGVDMGPVITAESRERIESLINTGLQEGAMAVVDGRGTRVEGYERGSFVGPTVLSDLPPEGTVASTEIFGPVLGVLEVSTVDEAIELVNRGKYGNMACLFTRNGAAARKFRHEVQVGNVGINIGVAAPMAFFPFSGWKDSFFGTLHGQGKHAVEFFTQTKVVVERWLSEWSRKF